MYSWTRQLLIGAAAAAAAVASAPALADTQAGVEAWHRGDFAGAVREWRPLADKGDPDAQYNMGQAYRLGRGAPVDLRIAQSWFQKAAAQGHDRAQGHLGVMLYEAGKRAEAIPWIRRAADRGDPRAQYILGIELTNADLMPRDFPRAYAFMTRAASQGLAPAAKALTDMGKFISPSDRQKGIALAEQMAAGARIGAMPVRAPQAAANASQRGLPPAPRPVPTAQAAAPKPAAPAPAGGGWRAQLGAYGSPAVAQAQWASLSRKMAALGGLRPSYEQAGKFTRLRVGPFANKAAADRVCAAAKAAGQPCFPVAP